MTAEVRELFTGQVRPTPSEEPNQDLVSLLEDALSEARAGRLRSFIGTGFTSDGMRYSIFCEAGVRNVYSTLGGLAWLQHEYVQRVEQEIEM